MNHTKRTAFISGAAQGIGRRTAEILLDRGWTVGVYDISDDVAWAEGRPGAVTGHLDVRDADEWREALRSFAEAAGGGIDVLVNNAGILYGGAFEDADTEVDERIIDVNVKGVAYGAKLGLPYLKESRGQLINLASAAAIYGTPDMATYSASKFAVRGLTEALDYEWRPHGIRVAALWPLFVDTGMLDGVATTGTSRLGIRLTADDVAKAVVDCIDAGYRDGERHTPKPAKIHYPVGLQAKLLFAGSFMSPPFLTRFVNGKLTTKRKIGF
ncbi:SDR family oxidoreductase [Corynebacterium freneyi]|uniref:SDR family oxidoreductase n=1 Tax=Corynebacterium freneyi TaxID=134034 RepID=UPI001EF350AF|nr:SDR family oxidoreductase [Corynebacterium freneyi]MCG7439334.1 SDR family oxidoreductase [Corynebacterium freneyi]